MIIIIIKICKQFTKYKKIKKLNNYSDQLFIILLLGDEGVGKSSIILRYTKKQFKASMVGSIKTKDIVVNDKKVKIQIWDTEGHERFSTIATSYFRGAHGIVTVFDFTDRESYEHWKMVRWN